MQQIFVLLNDTSQTDAVAAAVQARITTVMNWKKMNEFLLAYEEMANSYMVFFYLIVLGITATVIIKHLVMAVFERDARDWHPLSIG